MKKKYIIILLGIILIGGVSFFLITKYSNKHIEKNSNFLIKLSNSSSSGTSWEVDVSNPEMIKIDKEYDDSNCPKDSVGCTGYNLYYIIPQKEGNVTIQFKQMNHDGTIESEAEYFLEIDKDKNIKETHSGSYFDN